MPERGVSDERLAIGISCLGDPPSIGANLYDGRVLMRRAAPLTLVAGATALVWSGQATPAQAASFDRIEAQCQASGGATVAARLLPDGTISRLDGSLLIRVSPADAADLSRDLDRIDFDRLSVDVEIPSRTRNYCLLTRAVARETHMIWIDPARASGQRRAALGVVTRILDLAD